MNRFPRPITLAWLALVAVSATFVWSGARRQTAQIERISREVPGAAVDASSVTGYVRNNRNLILPEQAAVNHPWIIDTQRMAAANQWSVGQVDYDNAPTGRAAHGAPLYRWWLRLVAAGFDGHRGAAIERAALIANPLLLTLLCAGLGLLVMRPFGAAAGGLLAAGIAVLFPFTSAFGAGQPNDHGLFLGLNLAALIFGLTGGKTSGRVRWIWLLAAAIATGLGGWVHATDQLILLGAGWIGAVAAVLSRGPRPARREVIALAAGALLWLGPLVVLLVREGATIFGAAGSVLHAHTAAVTLLGWLRSEGSGLPLLAATFPLLLGAVAVWQYRSDPTRRPLLAFALGLLAGLLGMAAWRLRWWGLVDVALLGLLLIVTAGLPARIAGMAARAGLALLLLPGLVLNWPKRRAGEAISPAEARALVERDLAQWLSARSEPGTIAFAPPALSASLCYYGGLRVVPSPYAGNQDGLAAAVRLAGVVSTDEAQALVQNRGIQYVILPSWDSMLDEFAKLGSPTPERSLIGLLRQWLPPRWLRPVPYQMPVIPGLESDTLTVFEVVEPQENALALSRLAEYFMETGRLDLAASVGDSLAQAFASDAGAMIARAQVALARGESRTLARVMPELLPAIADGRDEDLPWERRARLAVVLAQTRQPDLARAQIEFCLAEADLERLRSLGPVSLYRLLSVARAYRVKFTDPTLHEAALNLLPPEFRAQLGF
ncbi:MAG TPA: hypothetical protein VHN79_03015 [Lacunisphaera sp.]|nr:hypothetical protein [Lacunisphaera sp.]